MAMMMPDIPRGPQKRERSHLRIGHVDDMMEIAGACALVAAIWVLFGFGWALFPLGGLLVLGAELAYDGAAFRIPLPHRPHPIAKSHSALARIHLPRPHLPRPDVHRFIARRIIEWRLMRKGVWPY